MITIEQIRLIRDRARLCHEVAVSLEMLDSLCLIAEFGQIAKVTLEQMKLDRPTNTVCAEWAANTLRTLPADPKHRRGIGGKLIELTAQ
jgi:hypothetical protein